MPGRDGRGPVGMGQMFGRTFGFCGNKFYGRRNSYERTYGRRGYGYGPGYGFRNDKIEKEFLQERKEFLESQLELVDNQLEDLKDQWMFKNWR